MLAARVALAATSEAPDQWPCAAAASPLPHPSRLLASFSVPPLSLPLPPETALLAVFSPALNRRYAPPPVANGSPCASAPRRSRRTGTFLGTCSYGGSRRQQPQ
jgi:hypothetical protein